MANRIRVSFGLAILLFAVGFTPTVTAESAVELDNPIWLAERDLGLEAIAVGGETTQKVLVAGAEGYARLLDGSDPTQQVELATPTEETIRAIDWHPRGKTALMVGDNGLMLRYVAEDHSVTTVTGSSQLVNLDMAAIAWNAAGSYAYVAGESGYIWAYYEGQDGQGVFEIINDEPGSDITDIACQEEAQLCAVTTETDGIALIDTNTDHTLYWIGGEDRRWLGVSCAEPVFNRCAAIGEGRAIGSLGLNLQQPEQSTLFTQIIPNLGGEFTHIHKRAPGETLISMAPFQMTAWDMSNAEAYEWVEYSDVSNASNALAGERLVGTWGTTDDANVGFIVTSYGAVVGFHPPVETSVWTDSLISYILAVVVLIAVPGVIFGLIFMNSEKLQRKYFERRNAKREAAEQQRIDKEKAEKRAARKAKKS